MSKSITIVGGGIIGSTTAYYLSRHPSKPKVTLVEGTAIASAASGKSGGFLALDWHGQDTASLAELSFNLHAQLAKEHSGADAWGYRRVETLSVSSQGKSSKTSPVPWLRRGVIKRYSSLGGESTTAQVHPGQFTSRIAELARENGAAIITGRAVGLDGATVLLEDGTRVEADEVVVAAGPWTGDLVRKFLGHSDKRVQINGSRAHSVESLYPFTPVCRSLPVSIMLALDCSQNQEPPDPACSLHRTVKWPPRSVRKTRLYVPTSPSPPRYDPHFPGGAQGPPMFADRPIRHRFRRQRPTSKSNPGPSRS
jgi:hypothetical protein